MMDEELTSMTPEEFRELAPERLAELTPAQIQLISEDQLWVMRYEQIFSLSLSLKKAFTRRQILLMTPGQFHYWKKGQGLGLPIRNRQKASPRARKTQTIIPSFFNQHGETEVVRTFKVKNA